MSPTSPIVTVICVILLICPFAVVAMIAAFIGFAIGRRPVPSLCRVCASADGTHTVCRSCYFDRAVREHDCRDCSHRA